MSPPISLPAAASLVGLRGNPRDRARRLFRYLLRKEQIVGGTPIMVRAGGMRHGRRYLVTVERLRESCPELFSSRDEVVEQVRESMSALEDRIEEVADRLELVADHVVKHGEQLRLLTPAGASSAQKRASA